MIAILTAIVACLYASVGHGGASGYLAILSMSGFPPECMSSTALLLNVLVASISAISYIRAKHFSLSLCWPFLVGSIPCAFIGGALHVDNRIYFGLLAVVLLFIAVRLLFQLRESSVQNQFELKHPSFSLMLVSGSAIGFLSGIVGIGGGIFLTPLMLLKHWANAKQAAAISAVFIVVNSISGLIARSATMQLDLSSAATLLPAAFMGGLAGGLIGSHLGANVLPQKALRCTLAAVLIIASSKMLLG